jgi:hypothetical protein
MYEYVHIFVVKQLSKALTFSYFCGIFKGLHQASFGYFRPSLCASVLHSAKVKFDPVQAMKACGEVVVSSTRS